VIRFLLITILVLLIARAFWRLVDGIVEAAGGSSRRQKGGARRDGAAQAVKLVRDPVCGTHVAPRAALSVTADGTTHYFCSEKCRDEFRRR
jgi:YHS domain-containing protein